jgi:hypothetical protein
MFEPIIPSLLYLSVHAIDAGACDINLVKTDLALYFGLRDEYSNTDISTSKLMVDYSSCHNKHTQLLTIVFKIVKANTSVLDLIHLLFDTLND